MRCLCTDHIEEAGAQLRSALISVYDLNVLEAKRSTQGSDQDLTLMNADHSAMLRWLDEIVRLCQFLRQDILSS